jgi:serine/threonine protein phosphatase 1
MTYVMSDIHGMYEKYMKMLALIELSDKDTLYIIGDVLDRGSQPIRILQDMMQRPNVIPIIGNHELMALNVLEKCIDSVTADGLASYDDNELNEAYLLWQLNGCRTTMENIGRLSIAERRKILEFLRSFALYKNVNVNEKKFILVHAGFENFDKDRPLDSYTADELIWCRHDPGERYFDDENIYVVAGHTPTVKLTGKPYVLHRSGNIFIDCGACMKGGKLACVRLDDFMEYYA